MEPTSPTTEGSTAAGAIRRADQECRYSDDQVTKTRTVTRDCSNGGVTVPKGWALRVPRSDRKTELAAGTGAAGSGISTDAIITSPDADYLGATIKIDIASLPDLSTHTSVSDGLQTVSFDTPLEKRQVPDYWGTWSSPPESESATPAVLFTQYVNSLTLTLAQPAPIVGFELESNAMDIFTFTADFFSGSQLVGSVTRSIDGSGGARLVAVRSDGPAIDRATISVGGDPHGFSIAQLRYSAGGSWAARAPLPTGRRSIATATAIGILYAIGGNTSTGAALKTVQAYNPSTNSWSAKAPLPAARQSGNGAATITGTIYVAGGQDGSAAKALTRTLYAYKSSTNTWTTKANMPVVGGCGGSAVISGKLYVFSGCARSSTGAQVAAGLLHRYNPATNTWTTLASAPAVHFQPVVGVTGGKLYVVGGNNQSSVATNRLDAYNPATNSWTTNAAMPTARVAMAGMVVAGKLYVVGGRNGPTYLNTVEVYDPGANSWSTQTPMPTARAAFGVGAINNLLYAVGGRNSTAALATNERFTP